MICSRQTSRSFYLTLRVLPGSIRPQIGLTYLLARTSDTIADTELVPLEQRLDALHKLRDRILGSSTAPLNFGELARQQGLPAERVLLEKAEDSLTLLQRLSPADLKLVRDVLTTILGGQELDLRHGQGWVMASSPLASVTSLPASSSTVAAMPGSGVPGKPGFIVETPGRPLIMMEPSPSATRCPRWDSARPRYSRGTTSTPRG